MMVNDSRAILDDLLARWHTVRSKQGINSTDRLNDPTFDGYKSYRGWEADTEIHEREALARKFEGLDFIVGGDHRGQGGMDEPYRCAIYMLARNLATHANVWVSPRLPTDPLKRGAIVVEARARLTKKALAAGII